jgi:hypothetical protein
MITKNPFFSLSQKELPITFKYTCTPIFISNENAAERNSPPRFYPNPRQRSMPSKHDEPKPSGTIPSSPNAHESNANNLRQPYNR